MLLELKELVREDYEAVSDIYKEGIQTEIATFETEVPNWSEFNEKYLSHSRFVILADDACIIGWAALSPVSKRQVYRGVAEVSIYISILAKGQGVGDYLLKKLIESSELKGIWTLQASIFPENKASIGLHCKNGFRIVGYREKIGNFHGS